VKAKAKPNNGAPWGEERTTQRIRRVVFFLKDGAQYALLRVRVEGYRHRSVTFRHVSKYGREKK